MYIVIITSGAGLSTSGLQLATKANVQVIRAGATIIIIQKNVFSISTPPTKTKTIFLFKNKILYRQNLVFE